MCAPRCVRAGLALLVAALAAPALPASDAVAEARSAHGMSVRTVEGTVESVAWGEHAITLATDAGMVRVRFDRNTSVYLHDRLGTVRALHPGAHVRVMLGASALASWVEVRPAQLPPATVAKRSARDHRPVLAAPPDAEPPSAPSRAPDDLDRRSAEDEGPPDPGVPVPGGGIAPPLPGPGELPPVHLQRGG